jgi:hypothetical protein
MPRAIRYALLLALAAAPVLAQQSGWQMLLTNRLDVEKVCEVQFYSGVVERMVGDKQVIIAKAHCRDKRAFDVTRNSQFEPFQIKECQPQPTSC